MTTNFQAKEAIMDISSSKVNPINNILYCLEKFQITIIATDSGGLGNIELMQYLEELGWNSKGVIGFVESSNHPFLSAAEKYCFGIKSLNSYAKIISITEECLLKELLNDPLLTNYGLIIMNDALKRSALSDTILSILKKIIRKRSTLKLLLVAMSKEAHFFQEYFNAIKGKEHKELRNVILSIDEQSKAAGVVQDILYLKEPCADYVQKTIHTILSIHTQRPLDGDVIAYMASEEDISSAMALLREAESTQNLNYFKLSQMKNERETVFFPTTKGKRNVVFTIELYQNFVTQDRIYYVIDCGFMQLNWFESVQSRYHCLTVPVCKHTATLRSNWKSKHRMAKVFRLYTKEDFQALADRTVVEMRRSELSSIILYLKALAVNNILRFDFPSAPPAKNVLSTLETLYALGGLDDQGQLTDPVGYFMSESPLSPELSRCLFNSSEMLCSEEMVTIVCMLQIEPIFIITTNSVADRHKQIARRKFEAAEGDLITLLNVYNAFMENMLSKDFCRRYYLNYYSLMRVHKLREHLIASLFNKYKIRLHSSKSVDQILRCITSGLFMKVAYLHPSGAYKTLRCGSEVYIDRESSIFSITQPKYVVYLDLYDKSKIFMRNISVIKEEWLEELAPHYYKKLLK
ncbi:ceramide phosphoethanolamine synthase isoform X2 [Musca autumnalis]|uniref:ceramide phosphoethanolamine synthase isoform X2 n=1 Tax=Musca autumnalis TaxID=221902 RepID=UPI003CEF2722